MPPTTFYGNQKQPLISMENKEQLSKDPQLLQDTHG